MDFILKTKMKYIFVIDTKTQTIEQRIQVKRALWQE
jgi:hypothetical protein